MRVVQRNTWLIFFFASMPSFIKVGLHGLLKRILFGKDKVKESNALSSVVGGLAIKAAM